MNIPKSPNMYSSAFTDAIYEITATPSEIVEVDIYDNSNTKIIGRKRFTGDAEYRLNVANYAKGQLNVVPLRPASTGFITPSGRAVFVYVRAGAQTWPTILTSGMENVGVLKKLSNAPSKLKIGPSQRSEFTIYNDDITITPELKFIGNTKTKVLTLPASTIISSLQSFCINMPNISTLLANAGGGAIEEYHTMEFCLKTEFASIKPSQTFNIVKETPEDVRLCWWNYYGQIDYYTMRRTKIETIAHKNRIYTAEGYKTIGSMADSQMELISDYENLETIKWLSEMINSPSVWIDTKNELIPIEVTTNKVTTSTLKLSRLEISTLYKTKKMYQNI